MSTAIAQQKIRIRLKAFDRRMLDMSCDKIIETADNTAATAIGPTLANIDNTAAPISMCLVFANDNAASWKKSVQRPTSPFQCGITGLLLVF